MTDAAPYADVAQRLAQVHARIEAARARAGADAVRLVAVGKHHRAPAIAAAYAAGQRDFGENYAQELADKRAALASACPELRWHVIGPVQRNKAKLVVGTALVHTVDRVPLLAALDHQALSLGVTQPVLVQVNVAGEASKSGVAPAELPALLDAFADCGALRCVGLMTMPPAGPAESARPHFRALRQLRDRLASTARPQVELRELSMGMSDDLEVAIEEGATLVRVGTAIFGARAVPA
ncbi:MAG: YggS family pyridoxal phosphate-dependent enzyme [Nannocystaceae bacterium]|nr:YggS family pyridoxal phosphate-dependent enzyme [Nannocystaceae bacterium]